MKNILNRGFSHLPLNDFIAKVQLILSKLTGNPSFPITAPTLAAINTALGVLTGAVLIVDPEAREQAINAARPPLEQMLDNLADNLEATVNMDPVQLATTGFDMHKEGTTPTVTLDIPTNVRLRLSPGVSGSFQVLFDPVPNARGYQIQTTTDPMNGPWVDYDTVSSSRNVILSGFARKTDIWVRLRATGPNNVKSGWSDPATILVS